MTAHIQKPRRSILKLENRETNGSCVRKKVFFDEIRIQEYPIILGDNPAVYVQFCLWIIVFFAGINIQLKCFDQRLLDCIIALTKPRAFPPAAHAARPLPSIGNHPIALLLTWIFSNSVAIHREKIERSSSSQCDEELGCKCAPWWSWFSALLQTY